ncbi:formate dehydrogenase subunit gamma [Leeia sp. TBRC 13508]|uniref:Formate dehydrogenase subunit gamma n=1 Tax=Leeia speluncae TaxID=2884804 RepID=A0ABS8D7L5_9NEIS|nr:formate dehydrogenase subunit gamma [Leeia speluncae]MCB6184190.1 formate dehydrogenase subunit gamma [Leeia speluncae]
MTPEQQAAVASVLSSRKDEPGALLPVLHDIQHILGFIPEAAISDIAFAMNRSKAEIHGVISFYHDFRLAPPAKHELRLCRAEACQSMGSDALAAHVHSCTGVDDHGVTADGQLSVRPVYCLGACATAPAMLLDDKLYARVSKEKLDSLLQPVLKSGGEQ